MIPNYLPVDQDVMGQYRMGIAYPGALPVPDAGSKAWTVMEDTDGSGEVVTVLVQGENVPSEVQLPAIVSPCPAAGCWAPPPAPSVVVESKIVFWSDTGTWDGTQDHPANPLNILMPVLVKKGVYDYQVFAWQNWTGKIPGPGENVWIPPWKKVSLAAHG